RDIADFTVFRNRRYAGTESVPPAKFEGSTSGFFLPVTAEGFHGRRAYLPLTGFRDLQGASAGYFPGKGKKMVSVQREPY
ncbi:TPA: hypothetical protein ACGFB9_004516, partial [Escherichia coli]